MAHSQSTWALKKKYYGQENSYHTVEKKQKHLNELDMAAY